jgi:hypothetical protein
MIFAVEWNSDDIMPYQSCISNGVRDKEKYLLWLKQNPDSEWMQNFPEIKNHKTNYRTLDQIAPGTEYVYLIPIKNTTYFLPKFASGFDISSRVYDDVKNGNAIIVFDYNHEGNIKYDLAPVNKLVSTLGLPKEKVLLLHADFNVTKFQNDFYTYQPIDIFATWIRNDFREKIQAIHEMLLKSWPHMVPPQFEHIHLPAGHLTDGMLSPIWDDGIEPRWGFVEPPSLKPNTEPCSVEDYFGSDYWDRDRVVNGNDISALLADYLSDNSSYNPLDPIHGMENSSTFLSDFMEIHGQKGYHDVFEMFPNLLSELELEYEI